MLDSIRLQNFRSYKDESFEFEKGVNIVVGPNASGKTSLLEAILVLCRANSYKGQDKDLVMFNEAWARIDGQFGTHQRVVKIEHKNNQTTKHTSIDGKDYKRLPRAQHTPVVMFEPNHLRVLAGSPENRRNFFDGIGEQFNPNLAEKLRRYQRTLVQRNALLKQRGSPKDLFVWSVRLSELAQQIVEIRLALIARINQNLQKMYQDISGDKYAQAELTYRPTCKPDNYSSHMLSRLENEYIEELSKGHTICGPHRDDFNILLKGQDSGVIASRGEARTLLLVIKIIELELVEKISGQKPLLLLDDVFSELDGARRQALTKQISNHQTFITTTDADVVVQHFMDNCHIIPLGAG